MTQLLERAFEEVSKLPETEQDAFASWIMEELMSERRRDELFAKSPHILERLADEALAEHEACPTQDLNMDEL